MDSIIPGNNKLPDFLLIIPFSLLQVDYYPILEIEFVSCMVIAMLVSIITVCLNEKEHIEDTINSIINQTCQDFEWIVVDGGSIDGTVEILHRYRDRIRMFISETDRGIYNAMNKGIKLSQGEYCLFMNGGDYFYDDLGIEKLKLFKPVADIVYCGVVEERDDGSQRQKFITPVTVDREYLYRQSLQHQSTFIRRVLFDRYGLYDEGFSIMSDREFFTRVILRHQVTVQHLPELISVFRFTGITAKLKSSSQMNKELRTIRHRYFGTVYRIRHSLNVALSRLLGRPV